MTVRVTPVADPAPGTDWQWTIPGQYVAQIIGVYATLTTSQNPTFAVDSSGNGRNLTYTRNAFESWGNVGPFGGSPNLAVAESNSAAGTVNDIATRATSSDFNTAAGTIGGWVFVNIGGGGAGSLFMNYTESPPLTPRGFRSSYVGGASPYNFQLQLQSSGFTSAGTFAQNGWHHVAASWDGVNVRLYIDGVPSGVFASALTPGAFSSPLDLGGWSSVGANTAFGGRMAGWFHNAAAVGDARVAAYFAAAGSAAAYKAAVLADSPTALWMLDETTTAGARPASLAITDGTNTVGQFPGLGSTALGSSYVWQWGTQGPGTVLGLSGTVNYVQIPQLILPAGYTLGTVTPGIGGNDQWSNVAIWWDDALSNVTAGYSPAPYLDALLVPDWWKG